MSRSSAGLSSAIGERAGLVEVLRRQAPLEDALLATEDAGLHFLPAGKDGARQVEAASTAAVKPLIDQLGAAYDWVIVDLPPVLRHAETRAIGCACTGIVLVVRGNRTPRAFAQRATRELNLSRCVVLGCVLNARQESLPRFLRERV
jgi:Mrp family chromosome partitioning ATPase